MSTQSKTKATAKPARKTKSATVTRMLAREKGATLEEIGKATGWQQHSCRAFLTGLRKKGAAVMKEEHDGKTTYRIETTAAQSEAAAKTK